MRRMGTRARLKPWPRWVGGALALAVFGSGAQAQDACALLEMARESQGLPLSLIEEADAIDMALRAQDTEECAGFLDRGGLETEQPLLVPQAEPPVCDEQGSGACTGIPGTLVSDT